MLPIANVAFFVIAGGGPLFAACQAALPSDSGWTYKRGSVLVQTIVAAYMVLVPSGWLGAYVWRLLFRWTGGAL
ncbi:MAG: hypothetical protein NVSMB22_00250 [Chloroflexota bacterium]